MPKPFYFLLLLCSFFAFAAKAQVREIESIANQPSPEAYDLLMDSKGYIWMAHEFGISRYDGANFMTLQNPHQNSLSVTDLAEDSLGRIWCHNFSGQIFYIENLQMHLLTQYENDEVHNFPRTLICGDELIATSFHGLFIYNVRTGKSNYIKIPLGTSSLSRVGNKVISYGHSGFYLYEAGKPLKQLKIPHPLPEKQNIQLQNTSLKDTFYMMINTAGKYYKLTVEQDIIKVHAETTMPSFINTITENEGKVWINTKEFSITTDGKEVIRGMNLSRIATDNHGHTWMTSLRKGLSVQFNAQPYRNFSLPPTEGENHIRRIYATANQVLFGTTNGCLYTLHDTLLSKIVSIPGKSGSIERIVSVGKDKLLLAASLGLFLYDTKSRHLKQLPVNVTIKDMMVNKGNVYLATTLGVHCFPIARLDSLDHVEASEVLFGKKTRCRSIAMLNDTLFAAYNDGLYRMNRDIRPLKYNQETVYASSVKVMNDKVVIGTFSNGLLVYDKGTWSQITTKDGLAHNFVREIKSHAGTTWLIFTNHFQKLKQDLTGVENVLFPFARVGNITDIDAFKNQVLVSNSDGLYTMPINRPSSAVTTKTYIDQITVNGNSLLASGKLKYYQNHLQFQVSTPYYSPYSKIVYQYRIKNTPNSQWQQGAPGQTAFNLVALEPGVYDFEIVATDENRKAVSIPAVFQFEILPPWYQHWAFKTLTVLFILSLVSGGIWMYYRNRLRQQRRAYTRQLAIQAERQRISAEIHDDIGAGLLAMRLLTEMTHNKLPEGDARKEVGKIHSSITELSHKMREVIWSLNTDNDNLENLLFYIRRQAASLFENSTIILKVEFPQDVIPPVIIEGQKRRHIYLAVKEALHNCLKHSAASNCILSMRINGSALYITVADDGKGFAAVEKANAGNGLPSMKKRMQQVEGLMEMQAKEKTVVQFMVPLTESV